MLIGDACKRFLAHCTNVRCLSCGVSERKEENGDDDQWESHSPALRVWPQCRPILRPMTSKTGRCRSLSARSCPIDCGRMTCVASIRPDT